MQIMMDGHAPIVPHFNIGQVVQLRCVPPPNWGVIVKIVIAESGAVTYILGSGQEFFASELTASSDAEAQRVFARMIANLPDDEDEEE
jgi:hypothetical protein